MLLLPQVEMALNRSGYALHSIAVFREPAVPGNPASAEAALAGMGFVFHWLGTC